jgi:tetratricopeptide (TPR) repeat protein
LNAGVDDIFGDSSESMAEGTPDTSQPLTIEERQQQYEAAGGLAEQLIGEQKWSEALEQLNRMLQLNPGDPFAYLGIGTCLRGLGAKEEAIESISRAILNPASAQNPAFLASSYIQRGDLYLETGRYREAVDDLDQAVGLDNSNPNAFFLLGKARLRLVANSPGGGRDESGQRDLGLALSSLNQAIRLRDDFGEAYLERGRVLSLLRREDPSLEFAMEDLQRAVQLMGMGTEASAELASTLLQRANMESSRTDGSSEEIVADLRAAISAMNDFLQTAPLGVKNRPGETVDPLESRPETVLLQRAQAFISLANETSGDPARNELYQAAIRDCEFLLDNDPQLPQEAQARFTVGQALRMMNDLPGAIAAYTQGIEVFPAQTLLQYFGSDPFLRRGICYYHQGEYPLAMQDFEVASNNQFNPFQQEPRAMFWQGLTQSKLGEQEGAIRSYTRAIRGAPDYIPAYLNRGLAYLNAGRYDQAIEDFNQVLRRDPDHASARQYRDMAEQRSQVVDG